MMAGRYSAFMASRKENLTERGLTADDVDGTDGLAE